MIKEHKQEGTQGRQTTDAKPNVTKCSSLPLSTMARATHQQGAETKTSSDLA